MIHLTVKEIIQMHEKLIQKTSGMSGLRGEGMLESAVYSAVRSFGEEAVCPAACERAAGLAYAITGNHPFCFVHGIV